MTYFPGAEKLFLTVYIFTFVTGLPLNILALCTLVRKCSQKLVPVDILLFNLTISDLLLLFFLPFRMVEAANGMRWLLPYIFCPLSAFMYFSSIYITSLFLMTISVERYLAVAFPIKYKLLRKPIYSIVASIVIWVAGTAHCTIVFIVDHFMSNNETVDNTVCYDKFSPAQLKVLLPFRLEMCLLLYAGPFVITVFCYVNFVKIILSQPRIQKKRKQRAIGLAVATLTNFVVCFLPYNISHVVGFIQGDSPDWRVYALLLSTFNASLDPIIFYFSSGSLKKIFLQGLVHAIKKLRLGTQWTHICISHCEKETEISNISS
ncbi:free fatty acid receptor 2-like [Spea bombifrons]|uniref:free fatty acid receptor 2-like n=1 Tax=Spea bombifrons TaxID=233779 RepID=UPI00234B4948|nr:free fatty acid receptor 2-like [Spea bombifrons]